jgi:hypothetical protein
MVKKKLVYELKPLTLAEREICSNKLTEVNISGSVVIREGFTYILRWLKYGLKSIEGVEIFEANFDSEVNKLNDDDIADISNAIKEATQFPNKKKS